jgi:hypothetical protein
MIKALSPIPATSTLQTKCHLLSARAESYLHSAQFIPSMFLLLGVLEFFVSRFDGVRPLSIEWPNPKSSVHLCSLTFVITRNHIHVLAARFRFPPPANDIPTTRSHASGFSTDRPFRDFSRFALLRTYAEIPCPGAGQMHFGQALHLARPGLCRFSTHAFAEWRLWPLMLRRRRDAKCQISSSPPIKRSMRRPATIC